MRVTHLYHFQLKIYTCGSKIYYLLLMKHMPMSHFFSFMFLRKQPLEMLCKKRIYKVFANFTGKHLCWSLFFNKVAGIIPATLLKRHSGTGVFLWILRNFSEHLFSQNTSPPVAASHVMRLFGFIRVLINRKTFFFKDCAQLYVSCNITNIEFFKFFCIKTKISQEFRSFPRAVTVTFQN